jgi:formylglycine-generating enzyme required for sulfatase activity
MSRATDETHDLLFEPFLHQLRGQGFAVGVDHYFRLQAVLDRIEGRCTPAELRTLLCPLFATSPEQQEQFYLAFDEYFAFAGTEEAAAPEPVPLRSFEPECRSAKRPLLVAGLFFGLVCLSLLVIGIVWSGSRNRSGGLGPQAGTPVNGPAPTHVPRTIGSKPPAKETSPEATRPVLHRLPYRPPYLADARHRAAAAWGLVLLPSFLFILYEGYRLFHRRLMLDRQRGRKPPFTWPVQVRLPPLRLFEDEPLARAARLMRRRQAGEIRLLDVESTVAATVQAGGYPAYRYRSARRTPEYLVLLDCASFRDHRTRLFAALEAALEREGVYAVRFFFQGDPRLCRDERGVAVHLVDLLHRYPGHRLLLFSEGERLLDPITGRLAGWTALFQEWAEHALLTPKEPVAWGRPEFSLASLFVLVPATLDGLTALVEYLEAPGEADLLAADGERERRRDGETQRRREEWESGGEGEGEDETVARLRRSLGEETFQWLCACAVYPELQWDLTLSLGSLPCMGERLVREETMVRLVRLPWFASGALPDGLRRRLLAELKPEVAREVRETLVRLLEASPPPPESLAEDDYRLSLAVQRWLSRRDWNARRELLRTARSLPPGAMLQDYTLLHALETVPSALSLLLPSRLRRVFYREGIPTLGFKTAIRLAVTLLLTVLTSATALGLLKSGPWTGEVPRNGKDGAELVWIPPGEFLMGTAPEEIDAEWRRFHWPEKWKEAARNEAPMHRVRISRGFWLYRTEVTNAQYRKFLQATGRAEPARWGDPLYNTPGQPVVGVSWDDAKAYCDWAGVRLPTEAEWEYAARGGDTGLHGRPRHVFAWGDDLPKTGNPAGNRADQAAKQQVPEAKTWDIFAGYQEGKAYAAPASSLKPNSFGLYDVAGDVWEWCADWYARGYYRDSPNQNPTGPSTGTSRVVRGGSRYDSPNALRLSSRFQGVPGLRHVTLGFRPSGTEE